MRLIGSGDGLELLGMASVAQIRIMIEQLTRSKISLDEFDEWFTAASWNAHKADDPDAAEALRMIGKVELCLAEGENKPYDLFLIDLGSIAGLFQIGQGPSTVGAGNVARLFPFKIQFVPQSSADADKRFAMELSYTPLQPA